jgi:hypothetical protein
MGDIKVDIPDITVIIERGTEYLLTTQLNDVYQVSINTGDNYNVIVEQGDEYLSTIQTGDVYQVLVNTGETYNIVVDEPATIVTNGSGSYITVADYATNALYAYTLVVSGAIAYDTISASNAYFGNLIVSDSISANLFTGSFVGEFIGTSSWANSASYVLPSGLPAGTVSSSTQVSYALLQDIPAGIVSSSIQINTGSFSGSFTGKLLGTSSWASNAVSSSYAVTASFIDGGFY